MSKAQYEIYVKKVMSLAKTLVVKSKATAEAINTGLKELGYAVSDSNPASWKYYRNLSGEYHSTDVLMTVTSLDTLQTIDFTKAVLQFHETTVREYAYGTRFYNELVKRYPDQEQLIRGILNPVNIFKAIEAEDGEILYYDTNLVEDNETDLIPRLSDWCKKFAVRWNLQAYNLTDDLFAAAHLLVMYSCIPPVILNIRLSNCHTPRAHSFHIREYLASNGKLDEFADNLTKKQMLWLYRNISYIERNIGKKETFELLMQNILTERGLPLAEWSMRHNIKDQLEEIYPDIEFARRTLNFGPISSGTDTRTVVEMLDAERVVATGNSRVEVEAAIEITTEMENSLSNRLPTKILESSILDLTDATPFTLSDCLLNHWLYFATTEQYSAVVVVDNPKTGDRLTLTTKEAFIVYLYAFNAARGLRLPFIPTIEAKNVRRQPMPTREELRTVIESRLISEELINASYAGLENYGSFISISAFHNAARAIHRGQLHHRFLYATREHFHARGQMMQLVGRFYQDYRCDLAEEEEYLTWFQDRGFDFDTFTDLEAGLLADSLISTATGANLQTNISLKEMQGAMLRLMAQLSSYSIQFLQSINTQPIKVIDWPTIRVGDQHIKGMSHVKVDAIDVRVQDVGESGRTKLYFDLDQIGTDLTHTFKTFAFDRIDFNLDIFDRIRPRFKNRALIADLGVRNFATSLPPPPPPSFPDGNPYVPPETSPLHHAFRAFQSPHYFLTTANRLTIIDRWDQWLDSIAQPEIVLLEGIDYPLPPPVELDGIEAPLPPPVILDGIDYPVESLGLGGLDYPPTILDGLDYPPGP